MALQPAYTTWNLYQLYQNRRGDRRCIMAGEEELNFKMKQLVYQTCIVLS